LMPTDFGIQVVGGVIVVCWRAVATCPPAWYTWEQKHNRRGKTMVNDISGENEQFIQHELESGVYENRAELLDEAVRLLKRRRELQRDIQMGIDSGPSIPGSEVFRRLEKKAEELAEQRPQ